MVWSQDYKSRPMAPSGVDPGARGPITPNKNEYFCPSKIFAWTVVTYWQTTPEGTKVYAYVWNFKKFSGPGLPRTQPPQTLVS